MSSIIHQQEVGVVVIQAGKPTLSLIIHQIMGWKTALQLKSRLKETFTQRGDGGKNHTCTPGHCTSACTRVSLLWIIPHVGIPIATIWLCTELLRV